MIELYRTKCNDCGGTFVENSFLEFLDRIFGSQLMTFLSKEAPFELLDIEREFEQIKRRSKQYNGGQISMKIPYASLDSFCNNHMSKDLKEVMSNSVYDKGIRLRRKWMDIDSDIMRNLFKPTIDKIINLMKNVFEDYKDEHKVMEIYMVGGFSNCSLVQNVVRQNFPNQNIIIPVDPGRKEQCYVDISLTSTYTFHRLR